MDKKESLHGNQNLSNKTKISSEIRNYVMCQGNINSKIQDELRFSSRMQNKWRKK